MRYGIASRSIARAGGYTTEDGTEYGYLLRVFFQTEPLAWEIRLLRFNK
jgi:hypothetical protein